MRKALVLSLLRRLARAWPHGAVVAAQALAALTRPLRHGVRDDWIAAVFPRLDHDARRAVRQETWESFLKGEAAEAGVRRRRNQRDYPPLLPSEALDALRPPLIVASFHVGPFQALGVVLRSIGEPYIVTREQFLGRPGSTMLHEGDDELQRARTLNRTVGGLRSGGVVLVMLDGLRVDEATAGTIEVPMLGRSLPLARGAFALARISGVPIVPIVVRWRGTAMAVTIGDRIGPDLGEAGMAAAAGGWLERYLIERPGQIGVFLLDLLRPPVTR